MTFLHPEFIYMMLPILVILFALLLTQSEVQEQFFSPRVLAKLRVDTNQLSARTRNLFYFLMFVFIILALAGPVVEKGSAKVKVKNDSFLVALDISASMLCEDVYPNRLQLSKQKIMALIQRGERTKVGLISFAKNSYMVAPPTLDHHLLHFLLKPIESPQEREQGTNILTLLKAAESMFEEEREKQLIIVSDGGERETFIQEIAYAKSRGIKVYTLGVGTVRGGTIPKVKSAYTQQEAQVHITRLNPAFEQLAIESGGASIQLDEVEHFFPTVVSNSSEDEEKPIYFHFFILPISLAMLMLLIATSSFYRGENYHLPTLLLVIAMGAQPQLLKAGVFDYRALDNANEAYSDEDYRVSSSIYSQYALEHESIEALYNAANGYYKMGRYKMAVELYESIHFVEGEKNHRLYHNLGNALAKLGEVSDLKKAVKAYQKALTFREDRESRENLEKVEKILYKREKDQKNTAEQRTTFAFSHAKKVAADTTESKRDSEVKSSKPLAPEKIAMSDMEAKKWLKVLDDRYPAQHYKIEVANPDEGAESEKPW
ncbi:MAG: VWA domain-containing protein [Sulfurimonadaceae bacterium]